MNYLRATIATICTPPDVWIYFLLYCIALLLCSMFLYLPAIPLSFASTHRFITAPSITATLIFYNCYRTYRVLHTYALRTEAARPVKSYDRSTLFANRIY